MAFHPIVTFSERSVLGYLMRALPIKIYCFAAFAVAGLAACGDRAIISGEVEDRCLSARTK
jgi:hypothetical protein